MKHLEELLATGLLFSKKLYCILLLAAVFSAASCSKDDDEIITPVTYAVENPLNKYHEAAGFTVTTNFINSGNYEFGLAFSPDVKGKMTAITVKLPDTNANLRVTVWDYTAKTVLRTETVNVTASNTLITKEISELALEKDKKYMITMNSNDWYKRSKPDNTNAVYPITAGNIKILEYKWGSGTAQTFPAMTSLDYNGGDLSFNFQQVD
ncbi:DUF4082 domain-containing protein [Chryseobacterium arthrosphaerae]|uniref:DUF4082 domain-containing protein n=1 Tax=Chryseobacterium arthrosphaerae TaxID=651561 RepID=UPI000F50C352|nr:DUF4082 domain-containing protein [Chryseobacterium arthrosphaerae]AYZ11687.1 DUF4082 domain-containing protein [Chryseobacterium arthrosphaerae]